MRYDPVARRLTVRLTDEGRTVIPGAMGRLPQFRVIDPNSDSELSITLPATIVKLAETSAPSGDLTLEEHRTTDATEVDVDIAFADTPFYQDPRRRDDTRLPAEQWQQGQLRLSGRTEPQAPRSR
jgi:hypothetical protein